MNGMWCFRRGFRCLLSTKEGKDEGHRGEEEEFERRGGVRIGYRLSYFGVAGAW